MHSQQNKTSHILGCQDEGLRKKWILWNTWGGEKTGVIKDDRKEINFLSCGHMLPRWCSMKSIPVLISASSWASRVLAGSLHADLGMAEKVRVGVTGYWEKKICSSGGVFLILILSCVRFIDISLELILYVSEKSSSSVFVGRIVCHCIIAYI